MPILQQNALVTIYLKAFLLTITSINTSYATKPFRIVNRGYRYCHIRRHFYAVVVSAVNV
ncbi:UNVERIFIED_CONTAM: hypothetical protein LBW93_05680 [Wolbachia endosymbiont of Nasonia longicornis]